LVATTFKRFEKTDSINGIFEENQNSDKKPIFTGDVVPAQGRWNRISMNIFKTISTQINGI
jgi:hypothetical protein